MKRNRMLRSGSAVLVIALGLVFSGVTFAAQKKAMEDVDVDKLTEETQVTVGSADSSMNLVWIIPAEFWQASLSKDKTVPEADRRELLAVLNKYMIVGVVRAEITPLGGFRFVDEKSAFDNLQMSYVNDAGKRVTMKLHRKVDDDAQIVVEMIKPMLRAAMGRMGDNFHLFICSNAAGAEGKKINPYEKGAIAVSLDKVGRCEGGTAEVAFPLDSLFVPRKCTKCAKHAHISWSFCPWCGTEHSK